jgi:hypothetical protein
MLYVLGLALMAASTNLAGSLNDPNYVNAGKKALLKVDVAKDGTVDSCEVLKTSGDSAWDSQMCRILAFNKKLEPTRNEKGRPMRSHRIVPVWQ